MSHAMPSSRPHVAFKAGRMTYDPATGQVTPDLRKGILQVVTAEDSLTHLQWRTRPNGEVEQEHDLIVFPGETEMKRVRSSPSRVYVLKWIDASTRLFFWLQYGDESADAANIERLNSVLRDGPNQVPAPPPALRIPDDTPGDAPQTPSSAPAAMDTTPATATPSMSDAKTGEKSKLTMESLSRMLDGIGSRNNAPTVGELLRRPEMTGAAMDCNNDELAEVYETLPEIERNPESVAELLRNEAVLLQALELTRALYDAPPSEVLPSLGLPAPDDVNALGLPALIDAVKKAVRQENERQDK